MSQIQENRYASNVEPPEDPGSKLENEIKSNLEKQRNIFSKTTPGA